MQEQSNAKLYGIFGTNATNFSLSNAAEKIKTKNAEYYKKALFQYLKTTKTSLNSVEPGFEKV